MSREPSLTSDLTVSICLVESVPACNRNLSRARALRSVTGEIFKVCNYCNGVLVYSLR